MWEALNAPGWKCAASTPRGIAEDGVSPFFEWVKERSHLSRGIAHGTLLRDDTFRFLRLGTFFERADNTARILDVKYHILLPSLSDVGGAADYYHWGALLRSVSAFESYRKVYRDLITPVRVAELLILRPDMPRSLMACMNEVNRLVQEINGPRATELAAALRPAAWRAALRHHRGHLRARPARIPVRFPRTHLRTGRPDQHHLFLVDR
jgi:uncharacterized alpha-E superfamily protein